MRKKPKLILTVFACTLMLAATIYFVIGNPYVFINDQKLKKAIRSIESETVHLNEAVPFEWDVMYTFSPYESREEIEKTIGFGSADIIENNISEGMVHLLFVKNKRVMASVLGYSEQLGYRIDFESPVTFAEDAVFDVNRAEGVVILTYRAPE